MMIIDNKFQIGDTVFLVTDQDQLPRIISSINVLPNLLVYCLNAGSAVSEHYDFEIQAERNVILQ